MTLDHSQRDFDTDQGIADLEQAIGDRHQAIEDRTQEILDLRQAELDRDIRAGVGGDTGEHDRSRRQAETCLAQTRRTANQEVLDDAQRARDEHQRLLSNQQSDLDSATPASIEDPLTAERRRAEELLARADAMAERARNASLRAAETRRRALAVIDRL